MVGPRGGRDFLQMAVSAALGKALDQAGARLPAAWHVHAHGLSDPAGDASEAKAISQQLASRHASSPVVSGKSYFGNLGAGSGAVELILSMLALEHGQLFPHSQPPMLASRGAVESSYGWDSAGDAFAHISYTAQGQSACLVIGRT